MWSQRSASASPGRTRVGQDRNEGCVSRAASDRERESQLFNAGRRKNLNLAATLLGWLSHELRRIGRDGFPLNGALEHTLEKDEGLSDRRFADSGCREFRAELLDHGRPQVAEPVAAKAGKDMRVPQSGVGALGVLREV